MTELLDHVTAAPLFHHAQGRAPGMVATRPSDQAPVRRHIATDRGIFARGALKAALWGIGRHPGSYDMMDVLGL